MSKKLVTFQLEERDYERLRSDMVKVGAKIMGAYIKDMVFNSSFARVSESVDIDDNWIKLIKAMDSIDSSIIDVISFKAGTHTDFIKMAVYLRDLIKGTTAQTSVVDTPNVFPYTGWKIKPNPDSGQKEPYYDGGVNGIVVLIHPSGNEMKNVRLEEGSEWYDEVWKQLNKKDVKF